MKKFTVALLATAMLISSHICAVAAPLYTSSTQTQVNGAITYEQKNILTENGWTRAYIAYIDLTNPSAAVKVLTSSKGSSYLSTVGQMAADNNVELAINGDFFNFSSSQTNMLGMTYSDGELISTPALDNLVSFVLTEDNSVIMDYFSFESTAVSPQGYTCPIYQINKIPVDTGAITMLTSKWATKTWGGKYKELIVENNVVTGINEPGSGSTQMPQNGYILVTNPSINAFLDNFKIGDTVTVETKITPYPGNIKEATGGNTLIVADGMISKFTNNIAGYAQRSSVGVTSDGKTLILAATDGRQSDCRGLTQTELAELMISLGAHRAINLDGGGSTTFVMKNENGGYDVQNNVSSQRSVSTAIGVADTGIRGDYADWGRIVPSKSIMLLGDSSALQTEFFDIYNNPYYVNPSEVTYTDELGNMIDPTNYAPQSAGTHTVYATYGSVSATAQIEVTDSVFSLELSQSNIELGTGETAYIEVNAYDTAGRRFAVSPGILAWTSSNSAITTAGGSVYASNREASIISAQYGDAVAYATVNKSIAMIKAPMSATGTDPLNRHSTTGKTVAVSGNIPKGATLLNRYFATSRLQSLARYDKAFVTSKYSDYTMPANCSIANKYAPHVIGNTVFATINNSKGYVATTGEWSSIYTALATTSPNVVIIGEKSMTEMSAGDRKILSSMLEASSASGKNVFYVSSADTTGVAIKNGVRYITCGTVSDYHTSSIASNAGSCSYVLFSVTDNALSYEFVEDYK